MEPMFADALAEAKIKDALPELERAAAIMARHASSFDPISENTLNRYADVLRTIIKLRRRPVITEPVRIEGDCEL